jgi:hypothetical protein
MAEKWGSGANGLRIQGASLMGSRSQNHPVNFINHSQRHHQDEPSNQQGNDDAQQIEPSQKQQKNASGVELKHQDFFHGSLLCWLLIEQA